MDVFLMILAIVLGNVVGFYTFRWIIFGGRR